MCSHHASTGNAQPGPPRYLQLLKDALKPAGIYGVPGKALKYFNKMFNKDSSNKVKDLN